MTPARAALAYLALGLAWVLFADRFVIWLAGDALASRVVPEATGAGLALLSALVIYRVLGRAARIRKEARDEHRTTAVRLKQAATVFDNAAEGVAIADGDGRILRVNRAFELLTGFDEAEVVGRVPDFLRSEVHEDRFYRELGAVLGRSGRWQGEVWIRRRDGEVLPEWVSLTAVSEQGRPAYYVALCLDLTAIKESERQLEQIAHYDPLTGLPNRFLFDARLQHTLERARSTGYGLGVVTFDLDRFKTINDSLGHAGGDAVLRELAQRLRTAVPPEYTVARRGGDEFAVIMEDYEDGRRLAACAERLLSAVADPFLVGGHEVFCSASVGIAIFPEDGDNEVDLIKNAESAMYRAKEFGRNNYQFYTAELTSRAFERLSLETSMRHALERGEYVLYYQPQLLLDGGRVIGGEALIRWRHPEMGLVSPGKFIPLAEESGLIIPIGQWVLQEACRQAKTWADAGTPVRIAVNLSGRQLTRPDLLAHVAEAIDGAALDPALLELEITESAIMRQAQEATANLDALRDLGIRLAIDDFGTGYSSMSYLKRFPVHRLKVDQSFIHDIPHDSNDRAISEAIIALGRSLHLTVTAEGVETEAQREFLAAAGCDEMQGFLFSPPLPPKAFIERIRQI